METIVITQDGYFAMAAAATGIALAAIVNAGIKAAFRKLGDRLFGPEPVRPSLIARIRKARA